MMKHFWTLKQMDNNDTYVTTKKQKLCNSRALVTFAHIVVKPFSVTSHQKHSMKAVSNLVATI